MTAEEVAKIADAFKSVFAEFLPKIVSAFAAGYDLHRGYYCGLFGFARDWSEGDVWHRGYMRGRIDRIRIDRMDNRDADPDPHQIDIGGEG